MPRKPRLDPAIFHLPVERMREGYYSDKYFVRARDLLLQDRHRPCVTMQVFAKAHAFLGGIDEAIAILRSEEHTSELQSRSDLVCRLLLEKKKQPKHTARRSNTARRGAGVTQLA